MSELKSAKKKIHIQIHVHSVKDFGFWTKVAPKSKQINHSFKFQDQPKTCKIWINCRSSPANKIHLTINSGLRELLLFIILLVFLSEMSLVKCSNVHIIFVNWDQKKVRWCYRSKGMYAVYGSPLWRKWCRWRNKKEGERMRIWNAVEVRDLCVG